MGVGQGFLAFHSHISPLLPRKSSSSSSSFEFSFQVLESSAISELSSFFKFSRFKIFIHSSARVVEIVQSRSRLILGQMSGNPFQPMWGRNLPKESFFKDVTHIVRSIISLFIF